MATGKQNVDHLRDGWTRLFQLQRESGLKGGPQCVRTSGEEQRLDAPLERRSFSEAMIMKGSRGGRNTQSGNHTLV